MLRTALSEALKIALREKDQVRLSTLRLILAAIKDRDIAARAEEKDQLDEDAIAELLHKMLRQRRESIALYEKAGRDELVAREKNEMAVIASFLPEQMDEDAIESAVREALSACEAKSLRDMGVVMSVLKERYSGQMDFGKAGVLVRTALL